MLVVLVPATWYVASNYGKSQQSDGFGLWIQVEQLTQKPQTYFQLKNPDSYVLQAITSHENMVHVGDWSLSQIDDLVVQYGVGNFEFNNTYYSVGCMSADPGPLITNDAIVLVVLGWLICATALIVAVMALTGRLPLRQIFVSKDQVPKKNITPVAFALSKKTF